MGFVRARLFSIGVALLATGLTPTSARGCALLFPIYPANATPEEKKRIDADYTAQTMLFEQGRLWDEADQVVLARVVEVSRVKLEGQDAPRVSMEVVQRIKGGGTPSAFDLTPTGMTDCGWDPRLDAYRGEPGQTFVVFGRGSVLGNTIGTVRQGLLVDPRALAALDATR